MQGSEFFSKILASFPLLFDIDDIFKIVALLWDLACRLVGIGVG